MNKTTMMRKTKRGGERAERFFYEELRTVLPKLKPTTNSGATFSNGDLATPELLIDVKSTIGSGIPKVSGPDLSKIEQQANALGKDWIIPVLDSEGNAAIIFPLHLAKRALRMLYTEEDITWRETQ
jgi:hypothetical protein